MSTTNRRIHFLDDALSDGELELGGPKPAALSDPKTSRTLRRQRVISHETGKSSDSIESSTSSRFPVKKTNDSIKASLVLVLTGSPWTYYKKRYRVKQGYSFGVVTSRDALCQTFMIRTVAGRDVEEHI
ncbi:hypothetical protein F4808DRAFT_460371 [Astrocystis sublimbata]|nr:hypothetical protein F4808DRAFT_460371 [Astrocystis sublimbata]